MSEDIKDTEPKKVLYNLPDSAYDFLSQLVDEYPKEDQPTLRKVIGVGKVAYEDNDLIPGMPMTAAVLNTKPFTLLFGRKFMQENMESKEDCIYILSHELTHLVLDHFAADIIEEFENKKLAQKAAHIIVDCQVNATVYNSLREEKYLNFIKKYYSKTEMPYCFFRPDGEPPEDQLKELHKKLFSEGGITNADLIDGLMPWFEKNQSDLEEMIKKLLGNHKDIFNERRTGKGDESLEDLSQSVGECVQNWLKKGKEEKTKEGKDGEGEEGDPTEEGKSNKCGQGKDVRKQQIQGCLDKIAYVKNIKDRLKISNVISPSSRIFSAIKNYSPKIPARSVIPNFYDQRTIALYSRGIRPIFHTHQESGSKVIIPCYLDVSGSQSHVLKFTIPAVSRLRMEIGNVVFCFSDFIHETKINELKAGTYKSSGGTSFNHVMQHLLKNKYRYALILTDGESYIAPDLLQRIKAKNIDITVGWTTENPDKSSLGQIAKKEFYVFKD